MKQWFIVVWLCAFCTQVNGQGIYDKDYRSPPVVDIDLPKSLIKIQIFEAEQSGRNKVPINWQGSLEKEVYLNEDGKIMRIDQYDDISDKILESFKFDYWGEQDILIEQTKGTSQKMYWWHLRDTLVHEIKLLKGPKRKLQALWKYSYLNDTLETSVVKFDSDMMEEYQIKSQYSEDKKIIRRVVFENGQPTRSLEAFYDEEGNFSGFRDENLKRPSKGEEVVIERDSTDQVTQMSRTEPSGKEEIWRYEHNESGKVIQATKEGKGLRVETSYDKAGLILRRTFFKNDKEQSRTEWLYDDRENVISIHFYNRVMGAMKHLSYTLYSYNKDNHLTRKDYWNKVYSIRRRWDYIYVY